MATEPDSVLSDDGYAADTAASTAGSSPVVSTDIAPVIPADRGPAADRGVAIKAVDLTLSFGNRDVLTGITTDIRRGAITALIGPTGSGKTTLLRTFNRMNDKVGTYKHRGDVLMDDRSIWHPGVDLISLRRRVGMLFQRPNPFPMSIMDNVVAGTRAHKMVGRAGLRQVAEEHLTAVGLWGAVKDRLKDSPFRLSGGQQQLLCLARALAIKPEILLLDEPTSALDPNATESIEGLIRRLVPDITVVIVTHNMQQAARVSDRTMFLNEGRLVEHGDTRQVFENPYSDETARYVQGRFG
jgi:phosphate transport system ATP-binding protein